MPVVAKDLFQYMEQTFPDHEVTLVYEAGCCRFCAVRCFLNLGWHVLVITLLMSRQEARSSIAKQTS
ncbi:hypothetical protein RT99_13890 [Flavobacterium sp. MEB061]|nr:hypothetical protein RT99_13890 [Flavobacterium sp. MEB061]